VKYRNDAFVVTVTYFSCQGAWVNIQCTPTLPQGFDLLVENADILSYSVLMSSYVHSDETSLKGKVNLD
jgi:hypothetical protein